MVKCGKTKSAIRETQIKTRFYVSGKVQDVGCGGVIIAEMINYGFREGAAINLPDGRVEVRIKGVREKIDDFKVKLSKALRSDFGADAKIENSGLHLPELEVMPLIEGAQAHLLLQFKKATDELGKMKDDLGGKLEGMREDLGSRIDSLPERIVGKLGNKIDSLGGKIDSLPEKIVGELGSKIDSLGGRIDSLGGKIDSLPVKIAFELKKIQN